MQNHRTFPLIAIFAGAAFGVVSLYDCVVAIASGRPHDAPVVVFAIASLVAVVGLWALRREDY